MRRPPGRRGTGTALRRAGDAPWLS
jgi:hypothetical protein